jgi:hypothetical protein
MGKKAKVVIITIFIAVVLALSVFLSPVIFNLSKSNSKVTVDYVETIHTHLDPKDISELENIARGSSDNYTRETAVFALTDIAIKNNVTEDVIPFLKDIFLNDKNDDVKTAAYSNLYLIKECYPTESKADMNFQVEGVIKKGANITLTTIVSSTVNATKGLVGVKSITNLSGGITGGMTLDPECKPVIRVPFLEAGAERISSFKFNIVQTGDFLVCFQLQIDFNVIDYQILEKTIHFTVGANDGNFTVEA